MEREFASEPQHRGGSKVCALHHNGHLATNTDEPLSQAPVSPVNKRWLRGSQRTSSPVVLDWTAPSPAPADVSTNDKSKIQ